LILSCIGDVPNMVQPSRQPGPVTGLHTHAPLLNYLHALFCVRCTGCGTRWLLPDAGTPAVATLAPTPTASPLRSAALCDRSCAHRVLPQGFGKTAPPCGCTPPLPPKSFDSCHIGPRSLSLVFSSTGVVRPSTRRNCIIVSNCCARAGSCIWFGKTVSACPAGPQAPCAQELCPSTHSVTLLHFDCNRLCTCRALPLGLARPWLCLGPRPPCPRTGSMRTRCVTFTAPLTHHRSSTGTHR
jgi:hypothetical protein